MKMKKLYGVEVPDCYIEDDKKNRFAQRAFEDTTLEAINNAIQSFENQRFISTIDVKTSINIDEYNPINLYRIVQEHKIPIENLGIELRTNSYYGELDDITVKIGTVTEKERPDIVDIIEKHKEYKRCWEICQPYFKKVQTARKAEAKKKELADLKRKLKKLETELGKK